MISIIFKVVATIAFLYLCLIFCLTVFQTRLIYLPETFSAYPPSLLSQTGAEVIRDQTYEWLYLKSTQSSSPQKILIYFHGNGGVAIGRLIKAQPWQNAGYDVVLAEYPGYGTNDGQPSEDNLYMVARLIVDHTKSEYPDADIYLYGESLGTGVATQMAIEYDIRALILESAFTSLSAVAKDHYPFIPVDMLLRDRYDTISKINKINAPLIMIHGAKDTLITLANGRTLFDYFKGAEKSFHTIDAAGHNDIHLHADMDLIINQIH